ncbi:MAG: hypothetical protein IKQ51_08055 [Bacteroidaceae bacterium]|jgi:hypothetical protein|nr:hypothetical protein [Bacteroidaceae bacterium]
MRLLHLITLIVCTFSAILLSGCSENCHKATEAGKTFLTSLFTCEFETCDALCTEDGKKEVRWFASNLTEEDLNIISRNVEITAEDCEVTDYSASITYHAKNVIVCDSLETKSYLGERSLKVMLEKVNGTWKVDQLEW